MNEDRVEAPWTTEQVLRLNEHQVSGAHPFTCPGPPEGGAGPPCPSRALVATEGGWLCACRRYTQSWAHRFMIEGGGDGDDLPRGQDVGDRAKGRAVVRRGRGRR